MNKQEKEYSIDDFLALFRYHWRMIAALMVVLGAILFFIGLASDPVFESRGTMQISSKAGGLGAISDYLSLSSGSPIQSEVEILRSRTVAQAIIDDLGLRLQVKDVTYSNPVSKATGYIFSDGRRRGVRSFRVDDVEFPQSSVDEKFYVTFTGDNNYKVTGPSGDLGTGTQDTPFVSEQLTFTAIRVVGKSGSKFRIIPQPNHLALRTYYDNMRVATLGSAASSSLIQVRYKANERTLAADVVNALMIEYNRLDTEWKLSQGAAQTEPIEIRLAEVTEELTTAEDALEAYKNEHGVVSLPDEARLAVVHLSNREAEKADVGLRIALLQDIQRSLTADLNSNSFAVPPTLTGDTVIQQLAADHAQMMIELDNLLLDYTENHPSVISKQSAVIEVRESIIGAISSTTQGLIEQRNDLSGVISGLESSIYEIPGVERVLLDLTRQRTVAEEVHIQLIKRLNEARIITSSITFGNRIIDHAVPEVEPFSPSIKRNGAIGAGLGFIFGLFAAFLLEQLDPRIRRRDQVVKLLSGTPVTMVHRTKDEDIVSGAGMLSLAALKCENRSLAIVCPGSDSVEVRKCAGEIIKELARGTSPLLLVDPIPSPDGGSFFDVDISNGISELAEGRNIQFPTTPDGRIKVIPAGSEPTISAIACKTVREKISDTANKSDISIFWLPEINKNPALRGWLTLVDGVVIIITAGSDSRQDIQLLVDTLEAEGIPLSGTLLLLR